MPDRAIIIKRNTIVSDVFIDINFILINNVISKLINKFFARYYPILIVIHNNTANNNTN